MRAYCLPGLAGHQLSMANTRPSMMATHGSPVRKTVFFAHPLDSVRAARRLRVNRNRGERDGAACIDLFGRNRRVHTT